MNISNGQLWKYSSFIENKNYSFNKEEILKNISKNHIDEAYLTISKWDSYSPTPLLLLNKLSKELNQSFYLGFIETTKERLVKGIGKTNRKNLKIIYNKLIPGLL